MKKLAIVLLLLIFSQSALADWFYNSEQVTVDVDISSEADIVVLTAYGYVECATVNMTFFPRGGLNQQLLRVRTEPGL